MLLANKLETARAGVQQKLAVLSPPERQVLEALIEGRSNVAIADDLDQSVRTVEIHRANVMTKMEARNLSHLVRMMLRAAS